MFFIETMLIFILYSLYFAGFAVQKKISLKKLTQEGEI